MIKVCLHSQNLDSGGPIHHVKNIAKYINRDEFDLYLATSTPRDENYAPLVLEHFEESKVLVFPTHPSQKWDKRTQTYSPCPTQHVLYDFLNEHEIDIFHDAQGGEPIFPVAAPQITAKKVLTNIFAGIDTTSGILKHLCISRGALNTWTQRMKKLEPSSLHKGIAIPLSCDSPYSSDSLRKELGISEDVVVFGKTSLRGGVGMQLAAYKQVESDKTILLTTAMVDHQIQQVSDLGIKNIVYLPMIMDYVRMSKYYNTLDVVLHARGESFGCAVAEPMIHGVPVVSQGWSNGLYHKANAQEELFRDGTYCAQGSNAKQYLENYVRIMRNLLAMSRKQRQQVGKEMGDYIRDWCCAPNVVKRIEDVYREVI